MERLPPMIVSQYGIGIDADSGVERRFMTITSGMLSVNVALSNEDWSRLVQMAEARNGEHSRSIKPVENRPKQVHQEEPLEPPFEDY